MRGTLRALQARLLPKSISDFLRLIDPKKVLHSFRHLVTDHLYKAMVMESMIEELTGRAGKTERRKRYAKGYRVQTLYEEVVLKLNMKLTWVGFAVSAWIS